MRITYKTLGELISRMSEEQQQCEVTVELAGEYYNECFSAELQIAGDAHEGGLDDDHPIIFAHLHDPGSEESRRNDPCHDVDRICEILKLR